MLKCVLGEGAVLEVVNFCRFLRWERAQFVWSQVTNWYQYQLEFVCKLTREADVGIVN